MRLVPRSLRAQDGFSVVEFAIAVLAVIVIGVVALEGIWAYAQQTNVRDSAELGADLAAANFGTPSQIGQQVCNNLDLDRIPSRVILTPRGENGTAGDTAEITVRRSHHTLTGVLDNVFLRGGLHAGVAFTIERPEEGVAQWWNKGEESTYRCAP